MKLVQLVDNLEYVNSNCWQHQLREHLAKQCQQHIMLTIQDLENMSVLPDADVLLSTLRLRSINAIKHRIPILTKGRKLYVYDQDPWESFIDTASCKGTYEALNRLADVTFLTTSQWWTDYINEHGMKAKFVKMWVKPEYCSDGVPWSSRPIRVGFKGKVHPYRQAAFEKLASLGVEVTVLKPGDYQSFLSDIAQMQFFFHEEANNWTINGEPVTNNGSWAKEIEVTSQGCFALRKHEPEAEAYLVSRIPGVKTYRNLEDIPQIIDDALADNDQSDYDSRASVDVIKRTPGWFNLTELT